MKTPSEIYTKDQLEELVHLIYPKVAKENDWMYSGFRIQLKKALGENYSGYCERLKDVISGARKISLSSVGKILEDPVVYAMAQPFEDMPLLVNGKAQIKWRASYSKEPAERISEEIRITCQFRLDIGK